MNIFKKIPLLIRKKWPLDLSKLKAIKQFLTINDKNSSLDGFM